MRLPQKIKSFFKLEDFGATDATVELMRMFILPFMRKWDPGASVDDTIGAFFNIDHRRIYHGNAKKAFRMPGQWMKTGAVGTYHHKLNNSIVKGQYMLIVVDRKDGTAKIDVEMLGKTRTYLLQRFEFETLKDWIEISETNFIPRHRDKRS